MSMEGNVNPALFQLFCLTIADVHIEVNLKQDQPDEHLSTEIQIRLDLIGALIHHGVICESPDEIADEMTSDFRNHAKECKNPLIDVLRRGDPKMYSRTVRRSEERIRHIAKTCAERALASYRDSLRKEGVDPDALPRIPTPAVPKL